MTRAFDFTVSGVGIIIAIVVHRIALTLFAPGSTLYGIATDASHFDAASKAWLWFQIIAIWAPLLVCATFIAWAFIREYKRQVATTTGGVRTP